MKLKNKDFKILIGGGTGYIGNHLKESLKTKYPTSSILSISRTQGKDKITWEELENKGIPDDCVAIYNFVGRNMMSGFWTKGEKEQLMDSRIKPTKVLSKLINNRSSSSQLELFCCASGTSYSFDREKTFTEEDKFDESIFPGKLCTKWEEAANEVKDEKVRVINARLGVVLSEDGGILQRMSLPFKFYLGSTLGDGQQYFPWIHLSDVIEILNKFLEDDKMRGPFNLVAPQFVTNYTFTQELASALNRSVFLGAPRTILSTILGEASCMVLEGCKIEPQRLKEFNYDFKYTDLKQALQNIYSKL